MTKLKLEDTAISAVTKMAEGNPGAIQAVAELLKSSKEGLFNMMTLDTLGIYGTDIYILWSDQCGRDTTKFSKLLTATQMGTFDRERLKRLAADQMRTEKITEEEFEALCS